MTPTTDRAATLAVFDKNRALLPPDKRGAVWRDAVAGSLCDYAQWAWRSGHHRETWKDLALAASLAPLRRGRLVASLALAMLRRRPL